MTEIGSGTIEVPGAQLYYERRGEGPAVMLLGSPMDSAPFRGLAQALAHRTVLSYDPRGIGHSTRVDTDTDVTPEQQADDVSRLLTALDVGPVDIVGSSGGAVVGLALVTAHPGLVRTLVAHEPPVLTLLPNRAQEFDGLHAIHHRYLTDGPDAAMAQFLDWTGLTIPPAPDPNAATGWHPTPDEITRQRATGEHFLAHLLLPTTEYQPPLDVLRTAPTRIIVGVGQDSTGQLARRTGEALAAALDTTPVEFPGGHVGFITHPDTFAARLDALLTTDDSPPQPLA